MSLRSRSKLAILDREFTAEDQTEPSLLTDGNARKDQMARLGNTLGADFLIGRVINSTSVQAQSGYTLPEILSIMFSLMWPMLSPRVLSTPSTFSDEINREVSRTSDVGWTVSTMQISIYGNTHVPRLNLNRQRSSWLRGRRAPPRLVPPFDIVRESANCQRSRIAARRGKMRWS